MGVAITDLLQGKPLTFNDLKGKVIAIDAFNMLYQFLTVLRGPDGGPLMNSKGEITSHLQGLLSRNLQFLKYEIKPIYVFDGEPPAQKKQERERRKKIKEEAKKEYLIAKERHDIESMRKYASRMTVVTDEIIESSKKLLDYLGIPYITAPGEGEAQAAAMVERGDADFVVSEDADAFLFGAPKVIRHLSSGKDPTLYTLSDILNNLGIDQNKLIALGMLVGTDYNIGGIKGIGPKKGLILVKSINSLEEMFLSLGFDNWKEIFNIFVKNHVETEYTLSWNQIRKDELLSWLSSEYDFSLTRLEKMFGSTKKLIRDQNQKGLGDFF